MAEWSNALHSKCSVRVTVPGVRIPLFPLRTRNHKRKGRSLNELRPFSFLKRFLNDSEYIEGYIIVPRETGTAYREIFHKSKITEHLKELKRDCTMKQSYIVLSVVIPIVILCVGLIYPPHIVAAAMIVIEIIVSLLLICENRQLSRKPTL